MNARRATNLDIGLFDRLVTVGLARHTGRRRQIRAGLPTIFAMARDRRQSFWPVSVSRSGSSAIVGFIDLGVGFLDACERRRRAFASRRSIRDVSPRSATIARVVLHGQTAMSGGMRLYHCLALPVESAARGADPLEQSMCQQAARVERQRPGNDRTAEVESFAVDHQDAGRAGTIARLDLVLVRLANQVDQPADDIARIAVGERLARSLADFGRRFIDRQHGEPERCRGPFDLGEQLDRDELHLFASVAERSSRSSARRGDR